MCQPSTKNVILHTSDFSTTAGMKPWMCIDRSRFCQWRTDDWGGVQNPPKFRSFDKAQPNFKFHGKYICNNLIRIIQVSIICKLSRTPD
jgi:hypothetical protein